MLIEDTKVAAGGKLTTRPITPYFGAEIIGLDLSKPIDEATAQQIRDIWIDAGLVLVRGADQDDEAQMRLSKVFGELEPAATTFLNDPNNKHMMTLSYDPEQRGKRFQPEYTIDGITRAGWLGWHWDQSFMPTIVRGAVLRMVEPSAEMGETGFADAISAYDRLPDDLKKRIEGLEVVYEFNPDFTSGQFGFPKDIIRHEKAKDAKPTEYDFPPSVHPIVITQMETGRKVLKLSPMHSRYILGMDRAESDALLTEVAEYLVDPRFAYFHPWQKNDMLVWDNWRMIHSAAGVPLHCSRLARRTTIVGDYNVGRYLDPELDRERNVKRIVD